jgi:hypothetical protein
VLRTKSVVELWIGAMPQPNAKRDKKLADEARLLCWWKAWHREQREAVLTGPHGAVLGELLRMVEHLSHVQPAQLIGFARSIDWAVIDSDTKLTVLHEINSSITKFREKRGEEPIDDALPGEPLRVFQIIRGIVTNQFPASAGEARRS